MESRRLVVWIAAGILGFQGGTLILDLLNCSLLSWLYVRRHGLELTSPAPAKAQGPPGGDPEHPSRQGLSLGAAAQGPPVGANGSHRQSADSSSTAGVIVQAAQPARSTGANPGVAGTAATQPLTSNGLVPSAASTAATQPTTTPALTPFDPTGVFCDRPRSRIDAAVSQGLSILAGLALGGSGPGGGPPRTPE
jgi:hypothetical protein